MALTDQPYIPLYVNDWITSNKLKIVSPAAHGLLLNIMFLMHKEKEYGTIKLKAKFKQNGSKTEASFIDMLERLTPFSRNEIETPFMELIEEEILMFTSDILVCKRMVNDFELSQKRAKAGAIGGKANNKAGKQNLSKTEANNEQNTENENENENNHKNGVNFSKMGFLGKARYIWIKKYQEYVWQDSDDLEINRLEGLIKDYLRKKKKSKGFTNYGVNKNEAIEVYEKIVTKPKPFYADKMKPKTVANNINDFLNYSFGNKQKIDPNKIKSKSEFQILYPNCFTSKGEAINQGKNFRQLADGAVPKI